MINKYRWSFPKLDGGGVEGMNDPGVETFKNDIYASLAKEILQKFCRREAGQRKTGCS